MNDFDPSEHGMGSARQERLADEEFAAKQEIEELEGKDPAEEDEQEDLAPARIDLFQEETKEYARAVQNVTDAWAELERILGSMKQICEDLGKNFKKEMEKQSNDARETETERR